ncbi:Posttranslational modification, protein turnover, chaperone [Salix suchowensis]|nr:Posttranslational modification, protein turnover, chaperone [Salix suchowensis]
MWTHLKRQAGGRMKNGNVFLLTILFVGFIQKLPATLVAAFRATLEMPEPLLLVNVVGIRIDEVDKVLSELDVSSIPRLMVWNKVDRVSDVKKLKLKQRENKMLSPSADPALLRPGRLDRKIEIPLPNEQSRMEILKHGDIDYEAVVKRGEGFNGADLRNVCTEAGMSAIRAELDYAIQEDFMKANFSV